MLERAAAAVEAALRDSDAPFSDWRQRLAVADTAGAQPSAEALAAYCAAAGESARVAEIAEPGLARAYLTAAFRYADQAHDPALAALAAERLSRTPQAASGAASARGAGPNTDLGGGASADDGSDNPCRHVGAGDAQAALDADTALLCAADRFAAAKDWFQLGRADLTLARHFAVKAQAAQMRQQSMRAASRGGVSRSAGDAKLVGDQALRLQQGTLHERALAVAREGLEAAERIRQPVDRARLIGRLLEANLDAGGEGDPQTAAYLADMRQAGAGDPASQAFADALAGRLALLSHDASAARPLIERALFEEGQRSEPLRLADWYLLMADADPDHRAGHVRAAYDALQATRPLLPVRDPLTDESTFSVHMRPVFEAAVDVQLAEGGDGRDGVAGAQQIFEAYREAEFQSVFGDECIAPLPPVKPKDLRPGEIILYPVLLSDRVELIYAAGGDKGGFHRLAPNRAYGRARVEFLTQALYSALSNGDDDWRDASRKLYDLLIAPIEKNLGPRSNLAIVPDGPLRTLPFAALTDPSGQFLIEKTRLSIAPALSYSQPGLDGVGKRAAVVAAALERAESLPAGQFAKLPGAGDEARAAAGLGATSLGPGRLGAAARRDRLLENFTLASLTGALGRNHVDVLHLATHAAFNGRSDLSYIVADGETIPLSKLRQILSENRARGEPLDLLVLSACETAIGDDQASMGLAGAAVQAGSRSALASVWQVDDASTVALMKAFYADYRTGASKSEALRSAQLSVLAQPGFAHPYYWAAFTLIGGWR